MISWVRSARKYGMIPKIMSVFVPVKLRHFDFPPLADTWMKYLPPPVQWDCIDESSIAAF